MASDFDFSVDSFSTEIDKRTSGNSITGEPHTIPGSGPFEYYLTEAPDSSIGVSATGSVTYIERTYLPVSSGDFYVDYTLGKITHHSDNKSDGVTVSYTGLGTVAHAKDMNDRSDSIVQTQTLIGKEITLGRMWPNLTTRLLHTSGQLQSYANPTLDVKRGFFVTAGRFALDNTYQYHFNGGEINLGPTYQFQVSAMSANQYKRIIFAINKEGRLHKHEGPAAATVATAFYPRRWSYTQDFPICSVLVQDDGTAAAGTIKPITQYSIEDHRPYFLVNDHKSLEAMYAADRTEYGVTVLRAATKNTVATFHSPFVTAVKAIVLTPEVAPWDEESSINLRFGYKTTTGFTIYSTVAPVYDVSVNWSVFGFGTS